MAMHLAFLSALAVMAVQPAAAAVLKPVVLGCNLPSRPGTGAPTTTSAERVFRIGPGSFQEWNTIRKEFGGNLCAAYTCVRTPDKTEGTVSSASVIYTVGVTGGHGYWSVVGAAGGGPRSGACRILTAPPKP